MKIVSLNEPKLYLSPKKALSSLLHICGAVDIDRGLAAQLERARSQVLVSGAVDDFTNSRAPRVENVVEPFLQQSRSFWDASIHNWETFLREKYVRNNSKTREK